MNLDEYRALLEMIPFGKRLPGAVYVFRESGASLGEALDALVAKWVERYEISGEFNVLKFRTDEFKVSFLSYPDFFTDAHPALGKAVTVDLATGRARRTDYAENINPPILHRKETFLPADHPLWKKFRALTEAEEAAGLYEETATIGFRLNWEKLLREKGVSIRGHELLRNHEPFRSFTEGNKENEGDAQPRINANGRELLSNRDAPRPKVERHRTALTRYELSRPVKTLLEYGLLKNGMTFFDYGCGQGADVRGLQALGYAADGWDPVHRRDAKKQSADVVNLGYVLNVIEDPVERLEVLADALKHARRLLVVSGLIRETVDTDRARQFGDGVLTRSNTFQKFFEQHELQQFIEDALDVTAVPVALGIFYVFREPSDQQDFLSARSRRAIDWSQISARLGLGGPRSFWKALYEQHRELVDAFADVALRIGRIPGENEFERLREINERLGSAKRALRVYAQGSDANLSWDEIRRRFGIGQPAKRRWEILYEEHGELLDAFWALMLELGRLPEPEEFARNAEMREKIGSPKQAMRLFIQKGGGTDLKRAAENRERDLLVYVALANLRKRVPFGHLSASLRWDIRAFFGNYKRALAKGIELLFAAGDTGEVELACEDLKIGWQDEQALYVHRSLVDRLPPVLRAYIGCATSLFGDVAQADVVKLHKASGKVTFLVYDDFVGKAQPLLQQRIKVNLRTRWVQVFDHSAEVQVLEDKHRFLISVAEATLDVKR